MLSLLPTHITVPEMARRLGRSSHTVKTQVVSLYAKIGATSRVEAIELGIDAGLLDPSVSCRPSTMESPGGGRPPQARPRRGSSPSD